MYLEKTYRAALLMLLWQIMPRYGDSAVYLVAHIAKANADDHHVAKEAAAKCGCRDRS